jgi:Tfp pilus assembly protein PilX
MKSRMARGNEAGMVLIITLALITLVTLVVVAYFARATTNRRIVSATSSAVSADMLARASLEFVIADLKTEIAGGSEVLQPSVDQPAIYRPSTPQMVVPARVLAQSSMLTDSTFNNLVKQSTGRSFPTTGYTTTPSITASTGHTTDVASSNNRVVSVARWNTPVLNTGGGFATSNQVPQWILIDRQGIAANQSPTGATFKDYTPGNDLAVVGRFAFNVYDVGGLLDANVAGYPIFTTALTAGQRQQLKSTQAGASLFDSVNAAAIIPGFDTATKQQTFVNDIPSAGGGWKFGTAGTSSALNFFIDFIRYPNTSTATLAASFADTGFLRPTRSRTSSESNTIAFSRHDLLRLTQTSPYGDPTLNPTYLTTAALPYFTHFSRELNAPSWYPQQNASGMGGNDGSGVPKPYAYFDNRDTATVSNRFLPNVRVINPFIRPDNTQPAIGDPLIKTRFPLRRIDAVGYNGVDTTAQPVLYQGVLQSPSATTVQRDFGLVWDNTNKRWNYVGATGATVQNAIERLNQVATENREPNFFELLKAVILSGSVGVGSGPGDTFIGHDTKYYDNSSGLSADYQIMQIGANIIDAWDADNIPTFIGFKNPITPTVYEIAGVENLPYLNKLVLCPKVPPSDGSQGTADAWLVPSLWNPHQNGSVATSTGNRVRIALTGSPSYTAAFTVGSTTYTTSAIVMSPTPSIDVAANGFMAPTPPSDPAPAPLATSGAVSSVFGPGGPEKYYGFHFAFTTPPTASQVNQGNLDTAYPDFGTATTGNVELQVQLPDTTYKTYQKWNIVATNHPLTAQTVKKNGDWASTNKLVDPEYIALDPRTLRFGVWGTDANSQGSTGIAKKQASYGAEDSVDLGPPANRIEQITWSKPQGGAFIVSPNPSTSTPSDLSLYATNAASGTTNHYVDLDSVQRRGDWTTDPSGTNSKKTIMYASAKTAPAGNYLDRPPNLSHQSRSVAELATVFRDQPWKTLNFTTANSADAALLDAFTVFEPNSVFRSDIIAGKISLNTRQQQVIKAVLDSVATNTDDNTPLITAAQRDQIASGLVQMTSSQPLINKSELVTRLTTTSTDPAYNYSQAFAALGNKEAREAVLRALSDVGQTRTWNLMIDVIAQTGKYGANASSVDSFVVQGEKRYWLHIAIDRFTGEIIDRQLEAVYE